MTTAFVVEIRHAPRQDGRRGVARRGSTRPPRTGAPRTARRRPGPAPDAQWCNPGGRALGPAPRIAAADPVVDAQLWVKHPGESDGACNGGPAAGTFWPEYALGLAQRAG